jgi:hypothetical protein
MPLSRAISVAFIPCNVLFKLVGQAISSFFHFFRIYRWRRISHWVTIGGRPYRSITRRHGFLCVVALIIELGGIQVAVSTSSAPANIFSPNANNCPWCAPSFALTLPVAFEWPEHMPVRIGGRSAGISTGNVLSFVIYAAVFPFLWTRFAPGNSGGTKEIDQVERSGGAFAKHHR